MKRSDGGCDDVEFARIGLGDSPRTAPEVAGSGTVSRGVSRVCGGRHHPAVGE